MGSPKYTDEYRRETADCIISTGRPAAVVAREPGMRWCTPDKGKRTTIPGRGADPRPAVAGFIESHCNRRRPHSSIGYRIPGLVMDDFFRRTAPGPESLPIAA